MLFSLLRKQLIRASGLSSISIWYPWKIKEAFFFFLLKWWLHFLCVLEVKQRKRAIKVAGVKGEQTGVLQREGTSLFSSQTHTHIHWNANSKLVACEQKSRRHAQNICMRAHTHRCKDTHTEKLQRKFLQPDITLLSGWLRGREMQIKREQRKGREGWERWRGSSLSSGGSSGSVQLTEQSVD